MFSPSPLELRGVTDRQKNIALFVADAEKLQDTSTTSPVSYRPSTPGGLKLPPFPARLPEDADVNPAPKNWPSDAEITQAKESIYEQLESFDGFVFAFFRYIHTVEYVLVRHLQFSASQTYVFARGNHTKP